MNVPFVTGDKELDAKFVKEATRRQDFVEPERTPYRWRNACQHLQCHADRGRQRHWLQFMKKFEEENKHNVSSINML